MIQILSSKQPRVRLGNKPRKLHTCNFFTSIKDCRRAARPVRSHTFNARTRWRAGLFIIFHILQCTARFGWVSSITIVIELAIVPYRFKSSSVFFLDFFFFLNYGVISGFYGLILKTTYRYSVGYQTTFWRRIRFSRSRAPKRAPIAILRPSASKSLYIRDLLRNGWRLRLHPFLRRISYPLFHSLPETGFHRTPELT